MVEKPVPVRSKRVSLSLYSVHTGSGTHPAFYITGTGEGRGVKPTTHLRLVQRLRMVALYLHSSIRLCGVMLN
jgi:hypothetical protein